MKVCSSLPEALDPLFQECGSVSEWFEDNISTIEEARNIHRTFAALTSNAVTMQSTCAVCSQLYGSEGSFFFAPAAVHLTKNSVVGFIEADKLSMPSLDPIRVPDDFMPFYRRHHPEEWAAHFTFGFEHLDGHFLDPLGVTEEGSLLLCQACNKALSPPSSQCPSNALANGLWTGKAPPHLQVLTPAEQILIGLTRSVHAMLFLKGDPTDTESRQRASKGSWMAWPHYIGPTANKVCSLPPHPSILTETMHVCFVGAQTTSISTSQYFDISLPRVKLAFEWLCTRNPLYADIGWDEEMASLWSSNDGDTVPSSLAPDAMFDWSERPTYIPPHDDPTLSDEDSDDELPTERSAVVDVNGLGPSRSDRVTAAIEALIQPTAIPRSAAPLLRTDPTLMPSTFPVLYPYGVGGFGDAGSSGAQSFPDLRSHAATLLLRQDHLFEEHPFWMPFAFDMLQRSRISAATLVRLDRQSMALQYDRLAQITEKELEAIVAAMERGDATPISEPAQALLNECRFVTGTLVGSQQSRLNSRKDLKAMVTAFGKLQGVAKVLPTSSTVLTKEHRPSSNLGHLQSIRHGQCSDPSLGRPRRQHGRALVRSATLQTRAPALRCKATRHCSQTF